MPILSKFFSLCPKSKFSGMGPKKFPTIFGQFTVIGLSSKFMNEFPSSMSHQYQYFFHFFRFFPLHHTRGGGLCPPFWGDFELINRFWWNKRHFIAEASTNQMPLSNFKIPIFKKVIACQKWDYEKWISSRCNIHLFGIKSVVL